MTSEFFQVLEFVLNSGYAFLTSFNLPGSNFTPLAALFFVSLFSISLRFLLSIFKRPVRIPSSPKKSSE